MPKAVEELDDDDIDLSVGGDDDNDEFEIILDLDPDDELNPDKEQNLNGADDEHSETGEIDEEELAKYGKRAQERIKQLTKKYREAERERDEARNQAANDRARTGADLARLNAERKQARKGMVETSKTALEAKEREAEEAYKKAFDDGDAAAMAKAAKDMAKLEIDKEKLALLETEEEVEPEAPVQPRQPSAKAQQWLAKNQWFNTDSEAQGYCLVVHHDLVMKEKLDPESDEYYKRLNEKVKARFPEHFSKGGKPPTNAYVVAPPHRDDQGAKQRNLVTLSKNELRFARKWGLDPKDVAKEKRKLERENG